MSRYLLLAFSVLASMPAIASDWQLTYYNTKAGSLFVDKDSIVDVKGSTKKVWTLYAPRVTYGKPGESYAYHKAMRIIDCAARMAAHTSSIYYDTSNVAHEARVDDKEMHDISPDSEQDYLWQFVCKPERQEKLAAAAGDISTFLADQVKFTKENEILARQQLRK